MGIIPKVSLVVGYLTSNQNF